MVEMVDRAVRKTVPTSLLLLFDLCLLFLLHLPCAAKFALHFAFRQPLRLFRTLASSGLSFLLAMSVAPFSASFTPPPLALHLHQVREHRSRTWTSDSREVDGDVGGTRRAFLAPLFGRPRHFSPSYPCPVFHDAVLFSPRPHPVPLRLALPGSL
ncbi:hypothetical protein BT69DRAFT_521927 [Atractiella rhizophila]|nr:hypothetical protein BT69DRAFT_521927 [Atractiella rhizophila]